MSIFKKSINHSKPSYKINEKLEMLDIELKKTGIFYQEFNNSLCLEESVDILDSEDVKYNWRDDLGIVNLIPEETDIIENTIIGEHFSQRFKSSQIRIDELVEQVDSLQQELFLQLNKTELNCSELVDDKFSSVLEFEHQLIETRKEISNIDKVYKNAGVRMKTTYPDLEDKTIQGLLGNISFEEKQPMPTLDQFGSEDIE
jgi:hypothetical protein